MSSEADRWQRVRHVFQATLERPDADRPRFLREACTGDSDLRREVESLLDAHLAAAGRFMESPAIEGRSAAMRPIASGTRLGPYEIVGLVGAGGMGEVYRARDTKLNRDVALKILPDAFAADAERLARFEREAQVLASLNHPNIGHIYGFEDSGAMHALVLEFVPGPTLADRIARGAMPLDEALPIARQIAEALEAAHDQGVIHRDLKPANIKVRPDGAVKVLDFGLAKLTETPAVSGAAGPSQSPTLMSPAMMTGIGMILGTAAYMAPEQAKGRPADKRNDVWALGCVLYEMLTGRRAFPGDDLSETFAAIIKSEPDWSALPDDVPPAIRLLIRRCLEKDPGRRVGAMAVARFVLLDHARFTPTTPAASSSPTMRRSLVVACAAALAAVAGLIATTGPALRHWRETPPPEMRVEVNTGVTPAPMEFALSPDGRFLVFVGSEDGPRRLWLRPLDQAAARPVGGTEDASMPFWSPDSRSIGFFAASKLYRVDVAGGPRQALADAPGRQAGGAWSADGTILFAPNDGALYRVPASGGVPVAATRLTAGDVFHRYPTFLPDGRHFLFFAQGGAGMPGLYLASLDGSDAKRLMSDVYAGVFLPPDHMVLRNNDGALVVRRVDLTRGEVAREARTLADAVGTGQFGAMGASASAAGQVAYRPPSASRTQLVWFDRTGKLLGQAGEPDSRLLYPDLSPDGRYVAGERK